MRAKTSFSIEDTLRKEIETEAKRLGIGWTTMLTILAREALDARKVRA